jgi:hypothetical protein
MRKLALVLTLLPLAACSNFLNWKGQGAGVSKEQHERGIRDVGALSSEYQSKHFYRDVRRRSDGRNNAFGRDLMSVQDFLDRHLWNYNQNDPSVNYPSDTTKLEHVGRFGLGVVTSVPLVDEITNR